MIPTLRRNPESFSQVQQTNTEYGQQQQQDTKDFTSQVQSNVQQSYGQTQSTYFDQRSNTNNYGPQNTKGFSRDSQSSLGQVQQTFQQSNTGYGASGYGQQDNRAQAPVQSDFQQTTSYEQTRAPVALNTKNALQSNTGYGQQNTGYGQQNSGYGQQQSRDQSSKSFLSSNSYGQQQNFPLPPTFARNRPLFPMVTTSAPADFSGNNQYQQGDQNNDGFAASRNNPVFDDDEDSFTNEDVGSFNGRNNNGYGAASNVNEDSVSQPAGPGRMVLLLLDKDHINPNEQLVMNPQRGY